MPVSRSCPSIEQLFISTLLAINLFVVSAPTGTEAQERVLRPGFHDQQVWSVDADKPWWALVDIRDMLNLFHPFSISQPGARAGASATLVIPEAWQPPIALRFYCADDYCASAERHKPGQVGTESFFDHRFKQVLVDDKVIWERDVSDENVHGSETNFVVDLTPHVVPGRPFQLTFRVFDKVTTTERNDRDVWFIGGTWYAAGDGKSEQPPRFHTAVWFADPVLGEQAAVEHASEGQRPHEAVVAARHRQRWPVNPPGDQLSLPVSLKLVTPATVPTPGFPLSCGMPMPPGLLHDPHCLTLRGPAGQDLPIQAEPTGWWPDGSVRWVLLHSLLPALTQAGQDFQLDVSSVPQNASTSMVTQRRDGEGVSLDTGAVRLELGSNPEHLLDCVIRPGDQHVLLSDLELRMAVLLDGQRTPVQARQERLEVVASGPVRAEVFCAGVLEAGARRLGRFTCRLYVYAGLPTVQVQFRVLNDTKPDNYQGTADDAPLEVLDLALVAHVDPMRKEVAVGVNDQAPVVATDGGLSLLQDSPEHCLVALGNGETNEPRRAQGWIVAGEVQASLWRFWQQYPKTLSCDGDRLEIGLFVPTTDTPAYRPRYGEAKRHDLWLTFGSGATDHASQESFGRLSDEPPRLFDGPWFCRSGAIAYLEPDWFLQQPKLRQWVEKQYGDVSCDRFPGHFGLRNFGDMPYTPPQWLNGYWAMVQGALNWGLAGGGQQWIERSNEIARHISDVDAVHLTEDSPDWAQWHGVTCALGTDHSVHNGLARWPAFQLGESLILHYWMTGDADSREAGLANAEWLIRNQAGLGSSQARDQARPMLSLLRAWQVTRDERYREAAQRYMALRYQIEQVIDWRRGAYIQPTYENWRCVSAGLDSMYAINVYDYYRLTGDLDAAQLVVAVADSVYAESMLPQEEALGSFVYYVRYSRSSWYYPQMAILFHMAYDLTGDLRFLRAGRAAFARYLLCTDGAGNPQYQPVHNFGWLDPEYGGWAARFADIETAPFDITTQTPEPDPANYQ